VLTVELDDAMTFGTGKQLMDDLAGPLTTAKRIAMVRGLVEGEG
jgi:hypothetical protein